MKQIVVLIDGPDAEQALAELIANVSTTILTWQSDWIIKDCAILVLSFLCSN
jgi:hypothetical protein